jgi:hypothetical protein
MIITTEKIRPAKLINENGSVNIQGWNNIEHHSGDDYLSLIDFKELWSNTSSLEFSDSFGRAWSKLQTTIVTSSRGWVHLAFNMYALVRRLRRDVNVIGYTVDWIKTTDDLSHYIDVEGACVLYLNSDSLRMIENDISNRTGLWNRIRNIYDATFNIRNLNIALAQFRQDLNINGSGYFLETPTTIYKTLESEYLARQQEQEILFDPERLSVILINIKKHMSPEAMKAVYEILISEIK